MANALNRPHSRNTAGEGVGHAATYSRFVQQCFLRHPASSPYYKQLLDYLASDVSQGSSVLQAPRYFELEKRGTSLGGMKVFKEIASGSVRNNPSIAVLEGFPSPECINAIGAQEKVRPELFIGHLDFSRSLHSSRRFFELPSLPSDRGDVVHVRLLALATTFREEASLKSYAHERIRADEKCFDFENQLFREKQYGATRFRKMHLHNSHIFSLEQMVSFSVTQLENEPWCGECCPSVATMILRIVGIYLIDQGKSLAGKHNLPWGDYTAGGRQKPTVVPIIPYDDFLHEPSHEPLGDGLNLVSLHPFYPIHDLFALEDSDFELLHQEPFFLLSRLLLLAARSWLPLLNFVDQDIQNCLVVKENSLSPALEQLRFNSGLLERIGVFLEENRHIIRERGAPAWPKTSDPVLNAKVLTIQASLDKSYTFLMHRCERLMARCESGASILVSAAQLIEAQKGINQARQVHGLTKLAFIFIPLSFVASLFGMNVSALKEYPSIWIYFVVAIP